MNGTELNRLLDLLHKDEIPAWLKNSLEDRREEIEEKLAKFESVEIRGPEGEVVVLEPENVPTAA
jgi:nitrate reductase NapAB chaperone NapD